MSSGKFVWIRGQRGPIAEKWPHDMSAGGKADKIVLAEHELSADEFSLSIMILEQRYPPPKSPPTEGEPVTPRPVKPSSSGTKAKLEEAL